MTTIILILFAFLTLNIIHHLTVIEQLKAVKQNQFDTLEYLDCINDDITEIYEELKEIEQLINPND